MAVSDEDWQDFLASTEEDPDEVETEEDSEDEPEDPPKDPKKKATKSEEDEADEGKPDDDEEDPDGDDSEEEDSEEEENPDDAYQPRLKQFLKSDGSLDAKKIEDAYVESGKRAVTLEGELKSSNERYDNLLAAIKAKPEAAKLLFGEEGAKKLANNTSIPSGSSGGDGGSGSGSDHPLLQHLEAQMNNASKREWAEFVDAHPESVTDPEKARKIGDFLKLHGAVYRNEHNGEIPSMKESLEAAYKYYGWDLDTKNKEEVVTRAKKSAATRTTPSGKRKATKNEITKGEQFFAAKLGVKLKT